MTLKKRSLTPGLVLIAVGIYFLMRELITTLSFWSRLYPVLFLFFAALLLFEAIRSRRPNPLFWGVLILGIGTFFVLRNYAIIPSLDMCNMWPVILIALGIAFIVRYLTDLRNWGFLIPGTILLYFGLNIFFDQWLNLFWESDFFMHDLWPLILIVIGVGIIISGLVRNKQDEIGQKG